MRRYFVASLLVVLSIVVIAVAGSFAAEDKAAQAIVDGAKQMMSGQQRIMAIMEKKGIKDPELTAAQKQMTEGYDLVLKGNGMMATKAPEGKEMVKHGAKMMLDALAKTEGVVEKRGMVQECKIDLSDCTYGEQKIKAGALEWFFGY
jgi:hypothetical protein